MKLPPGGKTSQIFELGEREAMHDFVDIVEVGKEKPISYKKAASVLQSFITVNGGNENDTFDESRIVKLIHMHSPHSWMISNLSSSTRFWAPFSRTNHAILVWNTYIYIEYSRLFWPVCEKRKGKRKNSEAGNRTPVVRVTGGNTKPLYYFGSVQAFHLPYLSTQNPSFL